MQSVRHLVGAHAVHRHAVRHRRSPRGVGAGVEVGLHLEGREPALRVGRRLGPDARGMPLGGGGHGLRARVDDAHRAPRHPRRHRQQRLHRHVELAAEAAAAGGRADAHARGVDAQHARGLLQVHVGRLRAGRDLDAVGAIGAVADGHCEAGLGLDVGVLDELGLEAALGRGGGARVPGLARRRTAGCRASARCRARWRGSLASPTPAQSSIDDTGGSGVQAIGRSTSERPSTAARVPTSASTASPRKRTCAGRQHRLILGVGEDAERVLARHVVRGQDRHQPRLARPHRRQVAEREAGAGMRRAHHAHPQRVGGSLVGAEPVGAGHLGPAVDPMQPRADGASGRHLGRPLRRHPAGHIHDRVDDLEIAGAAAQHAADAVLHLLPGAASARGSSRSAAAISMPGVQMPHCAAPCSRKARRSRSVSPRGPTPSTVWMTAPSACAVGTRQAHTCSPSRITVQAPQSPASQPILVPVRPSSWRSVSASDANGAASTVVGCPFSVKATVTASRCGARSCITPPSAAGGPSAPSADRASAPAPPRAGRRRSRGCRRWAPDASRCDGATSCAAVADGCAIRAASERGQALRDGRAGADGEVRRRDAALPIDLDDARHHHDRDHQIFARAELEEVAARRVAPLRHKDGGDDLVGAAGGVAIAVDEVAPSAPCAGRAGWPARCRRPAPAGWARRRRPARRCRCCRRACRGSGSARRRPRARRASGRRTAAGSWARMISLQVVSAPMRHAPASSAMPRRSGTAEMSRMSRVPHVAPAGARRLGGIDVGAARQHHHRPSRADRERLLQCAGAVIGDHHADLRSNFAIARLKSAGTDVIRAFRRFARADVVAAASTAPSAATATPNNSRAWSGV